MRKYAFLITIPYGERLERKVAGAQHTQVDNSAIKRPLTFSTLC